MNFKTYNKAIRTGVIILTFVAIFLFFTAEISMQLFTEDQDVIYYGSIYLKIWAFGFPAFPLFLYQMQLFRD